MRLVSCIVIDDEELARNLIENFISRIPHLKLLGKYSNPIDALSNIKEDTVELIFLDIQMPEMTGIEFLKTLSRPPYIILTTAYEKYALEGYELSVVDYLLKPFNFHRFLKAVNKVSEQIELREKAKSVKTSNNPQISSTTQEFLLINADRNIHRVYLKDILYIQSMKEYVMYYIEGGKILALGSLKRLEAKLPSTDFLRIHKSFIVAKNRVKSLKGNQLDIGDITLPIGGSYRNEILEKLFYGTKDQN